MRECMFVVWSTSVALNVLLAVETTVTEDVSLLDAVKAPLYPVSCTVKGCVKYDDGQPDGSCGNDKVVIVPYWPVNVNALDGVLEAVGAGVGVGVAVALADGFGVGVAVEEPPGAAVGVAVAGAKLAIAPCGRRVTVPLLHPPRTASALSVRNAER
jgi:hypothetical protein